MVIYNIEWHILIYKVEMVMDEFEWLILFWTIGNEITSSR